jgi:hypothetical protein
LERQTRFEFEEVTQMTILGKAAQAAGLGAILAGVAGGPGFAAEDETINAFSPWHGRGQIYATGEKEATFIGAFTGMLFIEGKDGPEDTGLITCPSIVQIELLTEKLTGQGKCTVSAHDNARAYAKWTCEGMFGKGCEGSLSFTGGTGRLEGLKGGGPMKLQSRFHEFVADHAGNTVNDTAVGLAVWRGLKVQLP